MNTQDSMPFSVHSRRDRYAVGALLTLVVMTALVVLAHFHRMSPLPAATSPTPAATNVNWGKLPLYFIENRGRSDERVAYYLQGRDAGVYFTPEGITLALREPASAVEKDAVQPLRRLARAEPTAAQSTRQRWAVKVQFVGAEPVQPQGRSKTAAIVSYFKGPQADWKTGLPTYTEVVYPNVWPGIEVVYSGDGGRLKTTFHVQPGADPRRIQLAYQGATHVTLTDAGRLAIQTPVGGFEEDQPIVYQDIDGRRTPVEARYTLAQTETGDWRYGFALGDYDPSRPLVIDPAILVYCGYIGGDREDYAGGIAVDGLGQAYVVGTTESTEATFPVRGGPDLTFNGSSYNNDAFIAKISADGSQLIYAGYIGGDDWDRGDGIAVDGLGQAYVVGSTYSSEASFPVRGGPDLTNSGGSAFIAKVSADGSQLIYAGYIGGDSGDFGTAVAVDGLGQAYVVGSTYSSEASFPVRGGPDLTHNGYEDAFVAKVSADGSRLVYAGYIGGNNEDRGQHIAVDGLGQAYVIGFTYSTEASFPVRSGPDLTYNSGGDAFVAKVSADGTQLLYAGYIGGEDEDSGEGIAVDGQGQAYVVGSTDSREASFPVRGGPDLTYNDDGDAFVAKVNADGSQLIYAGYIGGDDDDYGAGVALDELGQAYVIGYTWSSEASFPVRGGPDLTYHQDGDAFVAKVSADGSQLIYAGYIGGDGEEDGITGMGIAVNGVGQAYVVGKTESTEASFPVRGGPDLIYNRGIDVFVAKLADTDLALSMSATPNPASVGQPLTYTLTVSNNGPQDAPDVAVTNTLPAGVDFSNASTGCAYDGGSRKVTCTVGALTAGASTNVTLTVIPTMQSGAAIESTATVTSATVIDNNLANNQAAVTTMRATYPLTVVKQGAGGGVVSSSPAGIDCGGDCQEDYLGGMVVTLTANPIGVAIFAGWSGACGGVGICQVTMDQARAVTATFTLPNYPLTVAVTGPGVVTSSPAGINCGGDCQEEYPIGAIVILEAKPNSDGVFAGWGGACSGAASICWVTMNQARSVTATFNKSVTYTLKVTKRGNGSGIVTSSPAGVNCGGDCNQSYVSGVKVKLTARANSSSTFVGWSGACSGAAANCTVTMTQAKTVTAAFVKKGYYLLTISKAGSGRGAVTSSPTGINCGSDCNHSYRSGVKVKLTAKASSGSIFAGWKGSCGGRSTTCQVTMSKTRSITATFNRRGAAADELLELLLPEEDAGPLNLWR